MSAVRSDRIKTRLATAEDAVQLAKVFTDAFELTRPADVRRSMRRRIAKREYLVAVVDGKIAANVEILYLDLMIEGVPLRTAGIAGVATRWEYRRRGLATSLMREAIRRVRAKGISNTTLFTGLQLPAKRIYERLGYTETSRWLRFADIRDPLGVLVQAFAGRSAWLPKTPFGRAILDKWRESILFESDDLRVTVTFEDGKFVVQRGKKGKPTVTVRGPTNRLIECFRNRLAYDRHAADGTIKVSGRPDALASLRRLITLEWVE